MAADLQVFSSDSQFSRLPATVATTPLQYEHSRHPFVMAAFALPIFSFSYCLSFEGFVFRPRYRNCLLCLCLLFLTSTFVRSRSAFIRYILSGAKLVTAPLVRKVRARFGATLGAKKISTIIPGQDYSSNSSRPYGSILFRKPCKHFSEHL